ncbi:MAG: alanine racemase, partial [Thermoflexales bacterium]|nr:alanine racemase [Thermoflexales bacterium]
MIALTRAEIDLSAIRHNVHLICRHVGKRVQVMAVVKANAYGHGAVSVARAALEAGATWLGVASVGEGIALRDVGIRAPILVLGYTPPTLAAEALRHDLTLTVYDLSVVREIGRLARALDRLARVHVKLDTGMHRLGFLPHEAKHAIAEIRNTPGVHLEGVFTHLSSADSDPEYTQWQLQRFREAINGANIALRHVCNSAGTLGYPQAHYDLVRVGIAIYGLSPYAPLPPASPLVAQLRPALTLKTVIASVKWLPDGARVGYGGRYRCKGACRIAVIPIGYGDGFRRAPQNFG